MLLKNNDRNPHSQAMLFIAFFVDVTEGRCARVPAGIATDIMVST
jgi:hypothetical protein